MYSPNKPYAVWCYDCWFSDDWDALDYGRPYDPNRPFLDQFRELWRMVPKVSLIYVRSVNSDYVNISADNKDCYMLIESSNNEGCVNSYWVQQCRDCVDTSFAHQSELCYESDDCYNSYNLRYTKGCHDCRDGSFLLNCRGCSNCLGCVNLRQKQYYIFNEPKTKEEYEAFLNKANLNTYSGEEKFREEFRKFVLSQPHKFGEIMNAPGSSGNYIADAKNCRSVFHCYDSEDSKYGVHIWRGAKDCMDSDTAGRGAELIYNSMNAGIDTSRYISCAICWTCSFMDYSYYCFNSNHCIGSVGLRKKDYCILNKQYAKEEFEKIRFQIISQMKAVGEWGEFFPTDISTFGYNETAAQEQFPLTKDQALAAGFKWEDHPRGTYGKETKKWTDVQDAINDFQTSNIATEIFVCMKCSKNYRVIPREYDFYRRLHVPLPRLCPDCRHSRRFSARGPNRLWNRSCMCDKANHNHTGKCLNEFETSYSSDRPEIIYCETCYNAEVA